VGGVSASNTNAGWFDDDIAVADTFAPGGAPVESNAGGVVDNDGGNVRITDAGEFAAAAADMFVYVDFTDDENTDGRYRINSVDGANAITIDLAFAGDGENVTLWSVGGAIPIVDGTFELQDVLDDALSSAAVDNVDIYVAPENSPEVFTATLDIDTGGGTASTRKRLWATDTSYVYSKGNVTFSANGTNLTNGVVRFGTGAGIAYVDIIGFVIEGGGAGDAEIGINLPDEASDDCGIIDCTIQNVTENPGQGILIGGDNGYVVNTTIVNTDAGIFAGGFDGNDYLFDGCRISDSGGDGIFLDGNGCAITHCTFIDNADDGLVVDATRTHTRVSHCVFLNNDGDGISIAADATQTSVTNCASQGNGGFGYNVLGTNIETVGQFGWNHSHGETDCSDTGTWATLGMGNNIIGDPLFENIGDGVEDLGYQDTSPCLGVGTNESNIGAGFNDSTAGGGGGYVGSHGKTGGKQ